MSDSSDGETAKSWTFVNEDGHAQDSDSGASTSSCDVALDDGVVRFHHKPHRSNSCNSSSNVPLEGDITPTNLAASSLPANFRSHHQDKDSMVSSGHFQPVSSDCNTTTANNVNLQQSPGSQWPQGARPKTKHPVSPPSSTMEQSSSSTSTIVEEEERSVRALYPSPNPCQQRSSHQESAEEEDQETDDEEADNFATELTEDKADTSSMSSIEILSIPSEEWPRSVVENAADAQQDGDASNQVIQPLVSIDALNTSQDQPSSDPIDMHASDHRSTSGSDSDFVRINPSLIQEAESQDAPSVAMAAENDGDDYGHGASASPEVEEDPHWNHSLHSSHLSASSYSLPGDVPPVFARRNRPPHSMEDISHRRVDDTGHGRYHRLRRDHGMDEEGDMEDIPGPSRRYAGEESLGRRYLARRFQRDMSGSVSSSASDLSSFSFLGLRRQASHRSIHRQHSDDMSEISSVFTDNTDDLPANMMIGTTKPGPRQYKHRRAERLNSTLNYVVLLVLTSVLALGIGHYVGSFQEKHYMHQIRAGQVKRLRELQDDLITCLDKRTTEIDDKQTFADMVISLLGDDVQHDETKADGDDNEVTNIDCSSCSDTENRYSESSCDTLCVAGGFWADLDEAIADMSSIDERETTGLWDVVDVELDESIPITTTITESEDDNVEPEEAKAAGDETKYDVDDDNGCSLSCDPLCGTEGWVWPDDEAIAKFEREIFLNDIPDTEPSILITTTPGTPGSTPTPTPVTTTTTMKTVNSGEAEATIYASGGIWADIDEALDNDATITIESDPESEDSNVESKDAEATVYASGGVWVDIDEAQNDLPKSYDDEIHYTQVDLENDNTDEIPIPSLDDSCGSCNEAPNRYSQTCNTQCVEGGGDWADVDEALADVSETDRLDTGSKEDSNNGEVYLDSHASDNEVKFYNLEEITKMEKRLNRKQDKLVEEESGYNREKVIYMSSESAEEEDVVETLGTKDDPQSSDENEVLEALDTKDEDDDWIQIEDEDENGDELKINSYQSETVQPEEEQVEINSHHGKDHLQPSQEQDEIFVNQDVELPNSDFILKDMRQDEMEYKIRLKELGEQLVTANNRADMWQRKYVGDYHHQRPHPEVVVVESTQRDQDTEPDVRVEELEEQLILANARADMWQELYMGKSDDSTDRKEDSKPDEKSDEEPKITIEDERPKTSSEHDSTSSKDSEKKQHGCRGLGCFSVFEDILTEFLNSSEGKQFLRFANLTEVLNNATFWEEFATAANISAYTISDSVYKNWLEFQQYVQSAQNSEFITSFSAVLARAGVSVANAFGSVKNYSSTLFDEQNITLSGMGEKVQSAWNSVRNFTSDHMEQKINVSRSKVQDVWSTMKNFSDDALQGQNISLTNLKERVAAAWSSVRNMSKVVSNDTKKKISDIAGQVTDNVKDMGQSVHDAMKSMKDVVGEWHKGKKQKKRNRREEYDEVFDKTDDDDEDPSQERGSRRHTRSDSDDAQRPKNYKYSHKYDRDGEGCKGKKCNKKQGETRHQKAFGPDNKEGKKDKREKKSQSNHRDEKHNKHKHDHKHENSHPRYRYRDIDWEDELDVFNMNCFGNEDCLSNQRRDAAKLYEELVEYKQWLKAHHRKRELKKVRGFLEALADFLSDPVLDDEDLEDLKEEFEDVLEHVGRFVQDQHEREEENNTVIVDLKLLKKDKPEEKPSVSVPERRKFAGFGFQSDGDDDNWFLRRGKDRGEHHDHDDEHDGEWYHHWMQGRSDSRTGVTVWDMYQWVTDRFTYREDMRQQDDINWFLRRP